MYSPWVLAAVQVGLEGTTGFSTIGRGWTVSVTCWTGRSESKFWIKERNFKMVTWRIRKEKVLIFYCWFSILIFSIMASSGVLIRTPSPPCFLKHDDASWRDLNTCILIFQIWKKSIIKWSVPGPRNQSNNTRVLSPGRIQPWMLLQHRKNWLSQWLATKLSTKMEPNLLFNTSSKSAEMTDPS